MLMPMHELKAIYEVLFRDGVMVAKKDKRPQIKHPEVRDVTNLQVIRAMGSLKSRGYVRETFAWRHFYWYLTNDGIVYLRDYLHLPAEIIPASLLAELYLDMTTKPKLRGPTGTLEELQRSTAPARESVDREAISYIMSGSSNHFLWYRFFSFHRRTAIFSSFKLVTLSNLLHR
uniref:Plectin/eS10 N-terminal domain-containing protein n=1 Tax=Xiphophorus maculatus TaxID=8083 RepID=A0A3B5RA30_XIPMA